MEKIKSIDTPYNGYLFRSRAEARWAWAFDRIGMKYYYEPEPIGDMKLGYLPDFYLPESKTWFEVKGVMEEKDEMKIEMLFDSNYLQNGIAVGYPDMTFQFGDKWIGRPDDKKYSFVSKCPVCGKYYFCSDAAYYKCSNCGAYDGDHYLRPQVYGDLLGRSYEVDTDFYKALMEARSIRFDLHPTTPPVIKSAKFN